MTCQITLVDLQTKTRKQKGKKKARNTLKIISGTGPYLDAREKRVKNMSNAISHLQLEQFTARAQSTTHLKHVFKKSCLRQRPEAVISFIIFHWK